MKHQDEQEVQQAIRLEASRHGIHLWRNNNGAFQNPKSGQWVRYGLGNDSKKSNKISKSSDLIGLTPVTIGQQHVGRTLGVFTAVEVKHRGWSGIVSNEHERAQENFLRLVNQNGGVGMFGFHEAHIAYLVERLNQ